MNPTSTQRLRRLSAAVAISWALIAFALAARGLLGAGERPEMPFASSGAGIGSTIQSVSEAAREAGIAPGDRLVAVDGVLVERWLRGDPDGLVAGRPNLYEIAGRDGGRLVVELPPELPPRGLGKEALLRLGIPAVGLAYLAIGVFAWRLKPERRRSWAFLLFCSAMAAELALSGDATGPVGAGAWFVTRANTAMIGASAFHLFTTFPFEPGWILRHPQLRGIAYGVGLTLAAWIAIEPLTGLRPGVGVTVAFFFSMALGAVCVASLIREYRQRRGDPARDRATVVLLGAGVSFLPLLTMLLAQYFLGTPFPWRVATLGLILFPAAVGWGIARNELFDVRGVARSSAAYGAVTLGITGLFAFLVTFADALFSRFNVNAGSTLFSVVFLFLAILLFNPLRSRVQNFVDASFDRDRAAYRRAVREISEAMVSMLSVREIADRILVAVTDTMGVEGALVLLPDENEKVFRVEAMRGDWDEEASRLEIPDLHPICRRLWMRREELTRLDFDEEQDPEVREAGRDVFDALGAELLVPVLYGVELLGVIAVGRKISAERLGADDRQLLRTLANQSAIAIENARAFDEIAQLNETLEARVEERTRELRDTQAQLLQSEKMRSLGQLVAGVAHELNNPIGFVHANLQLIDEYVGRLEREGTPEEQRVKVRAALRKLVTRSREGTSRVKQIVQDLRTFSRADTAELQDTDLNEEIDRTLGLMESRIGHDIEVQRDYAALPRVRCFAGQLNQVFMNLLINACDALEGKGTIRIRTRPTTEGVRLEFSDDGPGIPAEAQNRIFEPFFTTKPVGQGTGLGLSLSHGIVEGHGGSLSLRSEPGAGATFTVDLPRRPPGAPLEAGAGAPAPAGRPIE